VNVGLLGGTFNPPHLGHLVVACEARDELGLDEVWLVPAAVPPHKAVDDDPGVETRARLCELAVAGERGLAVSRVELEREGPSWTVDTLRTLHDDHPELDLTFIVGGDNALGLPTWREPEEVLRLARLAVAEREGAVRADIADRLAPLGGADRVAFFAMPRIDISSSDVRARVAAGRSVRHLVAPPVADAIAEAGLYRDASARPQRGD
jgi:nicotinate-nucleotide adenylyltransferase